MMKVTHPKVISLPRGVQKKSATIIWNEALRALKTDSRYHLPPLPHRIHSQFIHVFLLSFLCCNAIEKLL